MDSIVVRRANLEDVTEILVLYRELSGSEPQIEGVVLPAWAKEQLDIINNSPQHLLVAELDGNVVGTVTLAVLPSLRRGGSIWAEIENLVVNSQFRRRGVAKALIKEAETIASKAGAYKIHLVSDFDTSEAFKFYDSVGFSHTGRGYKKYPEQLN